jgi:hypothetical protein
LEHGPILPWESGFLNENLHVCRHGLLDHCEDMAFLPPSFLFEAISEAAGEIIGAGSQPGWEDFSIDKHAYTACGPGHNPATVFLTIFFLSTRKPYMAHFPPYQ